MGFMDKAKAAAQDAAKKSKELAEQAQKKLDEAQGNFNSRQGQGTGSEPATEYDKHGRPAAVPQADDPSPPHGDPVAGDATSPAAADPAPAAQPQDPAPPHGDPLSEDRKPPAPPSGGAGLTSGDPLAG